MTESIAKNTYALIRVSTEEQNEARQLITMKNLGIPRENIVVEKESGKSIERKKYHQLVKRLSLGDVFYIENIDRLGRDYDGIIGEWHKLTCRKGITIKVLDTPILDTDQKDCSLLDKFIRNILLHTFAYQSENEWHKIKNRQAQGIAAAKAIGKHLGRPKSTIKKHQLKIAGQYLSNQITFETALNLLKIKKTAFYKLVRKIENGNII